jgi:hypothetical protein
MDESFVDREAPEGMSPVEAGLTAFLAVVAVAVLALGLIRSDPEPPPREVPVVASPVLSTREPEAPREEPAASMPASSCRTDGAGTVSCTDPGPFVDSLQIRTYPSRQDLYAAYVRDVQDLTGRPFRGNWGDCSGSRAEGEVSWSLGRTKSRAFPLQLLRDGLLDPETEAAGRVFCAIGEQETTVIWTEDPFRLATATGSPAQRVTKWWVDAHIELNCVHEPSDCAR